MFRIILFFLIFFIPLVAEIPLYKVEGKCKEPKDFNEKQKKVILYAYNYGAPHGLGYTMSAIAWKESCAGEYMVNFSDPSAGIYHAYIPGVIKKYSKKYKDTSFVRNLVGELLIRDSEFSSKVALETLLYWQKNRKGDYKNMIKSYNKGFSWDNNKRNNALAEDYYKDIRLKVIKLQKFIPKYSSTKNNVSKIELEDKNQAIKNTFQAIQESKSKTDLKNIPVKKKIFIMPEP